MVFDLYDLITWPKTISQFYSDISVLNDQGKEIKRTTSFVNSPLIYNGIYYYQTDWNLIGLRIKNENSFILQYPLLSILTEVSAGYKKE